MIIYLDNNATTKMDQEALDEMMPFLTERYANPSSIHTFGGNIKNDIEKARQRLADLINCLAEEIIFTGCGTESDNAAIMSCLSLSEDKRHIVTSNIEHPAVLEFSKRLEKRGYDVTYLKVDNNGLINLDELKNSIRKDTAVVSIMMVNNEVGVVEPIKDAAKIAHNYGALFHCDAVQGLGKLPIDMHKNNVDLMSFSAHKIHGPKGVGALYIRKGVKFTSFITGGHQERGRRAGTENVASIIGFGKACELSKKNIDLYTNGKVKQLRDKLEKGLIDNISDAQVNAKDAPRSGNTLSISFKFIEGESILLLLDELGICASSGSACTSGSLEPSHVLKAMDISHLYAHGTIRFSLSKYTTDKDIDFVIEKMPGIIERLRKISPFS